MVENVSLTTSDPKVYTPTITGKWRHIFNPNLTKFTERIKRKNRGKWYTNDHCFMKDKDGLWHSYGIIGYKRFGLAFSWIIEQNLFHITASSLNSDSWEEHDYIITADRNKGERHAWAPHSLYWNGKYYIYYAVGDLRRFSWMLPSYGKIHCAVSEDAYNWKLDERNPVVAAPGCARDPNILYSKGKFYMYYTCNNNELDHISSVAVKVSKDLGYWTPPKLVHQQPKTLGWLANDTESPFVVEYKGLYYMFLCTALQKYNCTKVYWSKNPEWFPLKNYVCELETHASEIIFDEMEGWFISNTGWDKKGLFLATLEWQ